MSVTHLERLSLGRKASDARYKAVRLLIEAHQDEFNMVHGNLRQQLGLSRHVTGNKTMTVEQKIEKLQKKIADLRASQQE